VFGFNRSAAGVIAALVTAALVTWILARMAGP
jgi:hypothetical protein